MSYILSCCSTADLSKEHFESIHVNYVCFHYSLDGVEYPDDLGQSIPFEEFYDRMAKGADTKTSQVSAQKRHDGMEEFKHFSDCCFWKIPELMRLCYLRNN